MKKKFGMVWAIICICLLFMGAELHLQAAAGKTSVAVSAGSVNIGDTLKVTARAAGPAGEKTVATMTVSYDSAVFSFVDCSATYGGGGGSVTATSDSFTVTLKAVSAGSSKISVAGSDGVIFDTNEELDSVEGSSTTVTVNNAASGANDNNKNTAGANDNNKNTAGTNETKTDASGTDGKNTSGTDGAASNANNEANSAEAPKLSADNSLKTLSISPGTLSPEFTGKTVQYTASVANNVTSVAVTATPANEKAIVESVTGNENLAVGNNILKIVVKAENGVTATYTITVTRQAEASPEKSEEPEKLPEEPEETPGETVAIGEKNYRISETFSGEQIPAGFSESAVSYHGKDYKGVHFDKGNLSMLFLAGENGETADAGFFIYQEPEDSFYPLIQLKHGDNFVIWKPAPADETSAESGQPMDITVNDGETMSGYALAGEEASDFALFYAVNQDGAEGWYQYDALEKTYQRHIRNAAAVQMEEEPQDTEEEAAMAYFEEEYSKLENELKKEKSFSRTTIGVLIFIAVLLLVVIINLILYRKGSSEEFDSYEEQQTQRKKKPQQAQRKTPKTRDAAPSEKKRGTERQEAAPPRRTADAGQTRREAGKQEAAPSRRNADDGQARKAAATEEKDKNGIEVIDFNDL